MKVITDAGTIDLGTTEAAPTIGIVDFSRRVTDDFGVTTVVERGFARRMSVRLVLPSDQVDSVQQQLAEIRATPALWVADERFEWLSFEGFYREFELDLALPPVSYCTLTVEGLTVSEPVADPGGDPAPDGRPSTLQLLRPVALTSAMLLSSNVPENDHPEWSAAVTYGLGAKVIKAAAHRVYESVAGGNVGNDPEGGSGLWVDIGPTNRWAMFDEALGTATSRSGSVAVTLDAGAVGAVALLDVVGATVRVQAPGYDETVPVGPGAITFLDLPGVDDAVTITVAGSNVEIGTLLVGDVVPLGTTEANPSAGINDFSVKETDEFGDVTIVERAWSKRMRARAKIRTDAVDLVANRIAGVRAKPSLWIGNEGTDSLTIYGFFRDFSIEVGQTLSTLELSIEGLSKAPPPKPLAPINWTDIVDNDPVNRPRPDDGADVTGENTSRDTENVNGKPAEQVISELDQLEIDMAAAEAALSTAQADLATARAELDAAEAAILAAQGDITTLFNTASGTNDAMREARAQAQANLDQIAAALVQAQADLSRQREIMRDAGITVDPATGQVRLYAFDVADERLNQVDIKLDAVSAEILLKASTTYVNSYVDQKITEAVLDPSQIANLDELYARMGAAELELDGLDAAIQLRATLVEVNGIEARVSTAESDIDALAGLVSTKVGTTEFNALDTRVSSAETQLAALDGASITEALRTARLLANSADDQDAATLGAILAGDAAKRDQVASIAEARRELTVKITDDVTAEARAREALAVRVGAAEASIINESLARIAQDNVFAGQVSSLSASLGSVTATVGTQGTAIAGLDSSLASLSNTVSSMGATVSSQGTAISNLQGDYASLSSTVGTLNSAVSSQATAISNLTGDFASLSSTVGTLGSTVSTHASAISTLEGEFASLDSVVSAQGVTVSDHASAISTLNDGVALAVGQYAFNVNVDGRVSGMRHIANGTVASTIFETDRFGVVPPGGSGNGLYIEADGLGRSKLRIRDGSIDTIELGWVP